MLLIVAGLFIAWALITAIWIPKRNPDFPATLTAFLLVSAFSSSRSSATVVLGHDDAGGRDGGGSAAEYDAGEPRDRGATRARPGDVASTPAAAGGDAAAGKEVFASAGCVGCHTLADAGATGTVGPNLDEAKPSADLVVERVTNGMGADAAVQGPAQRAADQGRRGLRVVRRRQGFS